MAQESCNLDKDEPEILKPSSPTSTSPPPSSTTLSSLIMKPSQGLKRRERAGSSAAEASAAVDSDTLNPEDESQPPIRFGNRCSSCRKRVGLTGFRCRCGYLFCYRHRYSDTHDCSFDYKAAGREEISKANPLIRAAKIIKI